MLGASLISNGISLLSFHDLPMFSSQSSIDDLLLRLDAVRRSETHCSTGDAMKLKRFCTLLFAAVALVAFAVPSFAQPSQMTQQQRELADYIKSHYTKREVMIPMRDGV